MLVRLFMLLFSKDAVNGLKDFYIITKKIYIFEHSIIESWKIVLQLNTINIENNRNKCTVVMNLETIF